MRLVERFLKKNDRKNIELIKNSDLFDEEYYFKENNLEERIEYMDLNEMEQIWGEGRFLDCYEYLGKVIKDTDNEVITYNNKNYTYIITNIYTDLKDGDVAIKRNKNKTTLTLITCTRGDKTTQTIYICERI